MTPDRIPRLNEQLKREISHILRREVRDPRVGVPTVTHVDVSRDLSVAKVYVRTGGTGGDEEDERVSEGLDRAAAFIRGELGRRLHLRRVPELRFRIDRSLEHAMRIERLLDEVLPEESPPGGEGEAGRSEDSGGREEG